MNWYLTLMTQKYASFSGRARRTEYWMFFLVYFVIALVIGVVEGLLSIGGYLTGIFALVHLLPSLGVTVRRLHDTGRSGWWILLFYAVPMVLNATGSPILSVVSLAISVWMFVELGCLKGTAGPNRFGPDPLAA